MKNFFLSVGRILLTLSVVFELLLIVSLGVYVGMRYEPLAGVIAFGALLLLFLIFNYVIYLFIDMTDNLRISANCLEFMQMKHEVKNEENEVANQES